MKECFTDKPDLTPYTCRPAEIPIDEMNPSKSEMTAFQKKWADLSDKQDLTKMDAIDDDAFNRIIWHSVRGETPYPKEWAGAHGRGLAKKGVKLDGTAEAEEEEED